MSVPYTTPQRAGNAPASSKQDFALSSSSVPFSMGYSQSKPVPPLPSTNPSSAAKGFNAAVAGGMKLKRAFAGRRKKSEDTSSVFAKGSVDDSSLSSAPPRIETSVSAPPQFLSRGNVISPAASPPPAIPPKDELTPPPTEAVSASGRNSAISISSGISSAVNYISLMDQQKQEENLNSKLEQKESWRKSDSTSSHHTVRPGGGVAKSSRPVSWAESFQSTYTVVQNSNRRLSALLGDADFGMPEAAEEDDDESSNPPSQPTETYFPSASRNRRSMSLNIPIGQPLPSPPLPPPSAPATDLKFPSHSISEGFVPHRHAPSIAPSASQPQPSTQQRNLPARFTGNQYISPPFSTAGSQPEDRAAVPLLQQRPPPHHPSSSLSSFPPIASTAFRQTTISITSGGIGPAAAGLAKRAVEKMSMGRKWAMGMGMSSSSSGASASGYLSSSSASSSSYLSMGGTSSSTSAHTDHALVRTESSPSVHRHRRTPGPGSGATSAGSISSVSITSSSDASSADPFAQPSGPMLGIKLRGALLTKNGVKLAKGGVVFGKSLAVAVRDTGVDVGKPPGVGRLEEGGLVRELERRTMPAVAVRCAQHILLWGVQEEGLFRVSGRPTHVSKLRVEFDSGADYDMTQCSPGDLDPHAVASVFKAYLRELPEPILTHKLSSLFDAAVNKETTINADLLFSSGDGVGGGGGGGMRIGARPGLPSGPKSGFAIRKPPSLSTLAMPSFTGPPPSPALILSIRALISQLPVENRDLLRTVVELIRTTAGRSKETKMPLSNLLLVFCPSLNMTPPLLKVLCDAEGIWGEEYSDGGKQVREEVGRVIDIRRQTMPARSPTTTHGNFFVDGPSTTTPSMRSGFGEEESDSVRSGRASLDTTNHNPSSDYHASAEESIYDDEYDILGDVAPRRRIPRDGAAVVERRKEVPTVYLDCSSSSASASSLGGQEGLSVSELSMPYLHHHHLRKPAARDDDGSISSSGYSRHASSPPPLLSSSTESVATPTSSGNPSYSHLPLEHEHHHAKEEQDQHQQYYPHSRHQRHGTGGPEIVEATPLELRSPQTQTSKRLVISNPIPISDPVQFPTTLPPSSTPQQLIGNAVSALKRRSIPMLSLSAAKAGSAPHTPSPSGSPRSLSTSSENVKSLHRSKKPSLKLLFSKRSTSSLTGARDRSSSFLSLPAAQCQGSPKQFQTPPRSASDSSDSNSSVSTPISAVTAPQSQSGLLSLSGSGGSVGSLLPSSSASSSHLPPVLDTPIEDPSFGFDLVFKPTSGSTIMSTSPNEHSQASNNSSSQRQQQAGSSDPSSITQRTVIKPGENHLRPQASTSNLSISSTASSNHLSLFDDDDEEEEAEDWTESVLLAADVDRKWTVQNSPSPL